MTSQGQHAKAQQDGAPLQDATPTDTILKQKIQLI